MNNKNSSKDFALKKEFIDLQLELRKFIDETELFTLNDIIKDPFVVHCLDDYINAYEELADIKKIKKTLKRLLKMRKNNVDINEALSMIQNIPENKTDIPINDNKINFNNAFTFKNSFFTLKPIKHEKEMDRDKMLQMFKAHFKRIEPLRKIQIPKIVVNRSLTASSSHSHLFKKIEKSNEQSGNATPKNSTEITANASFRNGIIRNIDKASRPNVSSPPNYNPSSQSNVIKATRSPYQSDGNTLQTNNSPNEENQSSP